MLIGIIKNIDKTYEYLYKINNELISFHVDNNGFSKSNKSTTRTRKSTSWKEIEYITRTVWPTNCWFIRHGYESINVRGVNITPLFLHCEVR